ncbi:hypothetical protein HU200_013465 [Digitaria exilis]|uniref:DUF1618 domain-containing protein n=1 Tax=Digitaria exilis TaxID=1010633 RepID=A0A835FD73_9POAL|nr:hypothetical protein HU200_013465 [Digitaria exilis]
MGASSPDAYPPLFPYGGCTTTSQPAATVRSRLICCRPPPKIQQACLPRALNKRGIFADDSFVADAGTVAYYPAITRRHLRVSLGRAPPPASIFIYYDFPYREPGEDYNSSDSSTCEDDKNVVDESEENGDVDESEENGDVDESEEEEEEDVDEWGIRVIAAHGDSVLVKLSHLRCPYDYESIHLLYRAGALGRHRWLCFRNETSSQSPSNSIDMTTRSLHKVGTQAFSDEATPMTYETGFLLCDVADEESPKVRYVPLPPGVCWAPKGYDDGEPKHSKNMGAAGASTVSMDDPLMWVRDGEIDCDEIWGQLGYEGLPQANLECPIMSLDEPNVVCFLVNNCPFVNRYEDRMVWMIKLNIKTKALLSAVQYSKDVWGAYHHLPA